MRVQSYSFGSSVFDVKREFENSNRKTKRLIIYFLLSGVTFYIVKSVFQINLTIFMDLVNRLLNGQPIDINMDYILQNAKNNSVVSFLIGLYSIIAGFFVSLKNFIFMYLKEFK